MAGTLPTFTLLRTRYQYLRGETDITTVNAVNDSNINQSVLDAANLFNFELLKTKTTGSISAGGTFNLPADYNPTWHIPDARIVNSSVGDDSIFQEIPVQDIDSVDTTSFIYWITYNTSSNLYVFNSNQTSGTVTYYYYFIPSTLTTGTDICVIPDAEAIAMLALGKNWIGDERNLQLAQYFTSEGTKRLAELYQKDVAFGPFYQESTLVRRQPQMNGMGSDPGINISHT